MRKTSTLFFIFALIHLSTQAQSKISSFKQFEIGGEGGVTLDYLSPRDPADNMVRATGLQSGLVGPKIRSYFDRNFFVEAAFLWKENTFGFQFKQQPKNSNFTSGASQSLIIPIRAGYELKASDKFFLTVMAGVAPSFITVHQSYWDYGNYYAGDIYLQYETRDKYKKFYILLQTGASLSFLIKRRVKLSFGVNYYHGFSDVEYYDINYRINNGPIQIATIANRGSFICYKAGLSYIFDLRKKVE